MNDFMGKEFLLNTPTARNLYHSYAENTPIIDYHCHINPKEIYEDKQYRNITELWLGVGGANFGDHYKWRLMRSCGVEESYISGTAPDEIRFQKWAECLSHAIGNPLYHWSNMELQTYFGIQEPLTGENATRIYEKCNKILASGELSVRKIIEKSNVRLICTTDDPADSLEWHKKLKEDVNFKVQVLPAWRPDRAWDMRKPDWPAYINKLGEAAHLRITCFADLKTALRRRMDFFSSLGCLLSDHGLDYVCYAPAHEQKIEEIFAKRLSGSQVSENEFLNYVTAFMTFAAKEYAQRGWAMQLHYGCKRNSNSRMYQNMGIDTGFDCVGNSAPVNELVDFLNSLAMDDQLPKTVLYSLNLADFYTIGTVMGCFQDASAESKIQMGCAWWFNDHFTGMTTQLTTLANLGNLSAFIGMLTDSRSFLSYTRHDYFRRILCRLLGRWVEEGLYPNDIEMLGKIVRGISFHNAVHYFGFNLNTD